MCISTLLFPTTLLRVKYQVRLLLLCYSVAQKGRLIHLLHVFFIVVGEPEPIDDGRVNLRQFVFFIAWKYLKNGLNDVASTRPNNVDKR